MKKQIKNLVNKLILGATFGAVGALGLYGNTNQAQAQTVQENATALYILGRNMQHRAWITGNRDLMNLGALVQDTGLLTSLYDPQRNQNNITPIQEPSAQFYVYNYWNDKNQNSWADNETELIGRDKKDFWEDENILIGIRTNGLIGRKASYEMIAPDGKIVNSNSRKINSNNNHYTPLNSFHKGLSNTIQNHGQGVYETRFFIDGNHIGTRKLLLKSNTQMSICNYIRDLNGNGLSEIDNGEFIGLNKTIFNENESFTPVFLIRNAKGRISDDQLFNPQGKLIYSNPAIVPTDNIYKQATKGVEDIVRVHGPGTYLAVGCLDGKPKCSIQFELKGTIKRPLEKKVARGVITYGGSNSPEYRERIETILTPAPQHSSPIIESYEKNKLPTEPQNQQTQKQLTPTQQNQINRFHQTIIQRARAMNQGNKTMRGDPIGFKLSNQQILELNGDFSERNILRILRK